MLLWVSISVVKSRVVKSSHNISLAALTAQLSTVQHSTMLTSSTKLCLEKTLSVSNNLYLVCYKLRTVKLGRKDVQATYLALLFLESQTNKRNNGITCSHEKQCLALTHECPPPSTRPPAPRVDSFVKVEHMINEKTILMKMNHPFIVKLAGTFHDERSLFMILEYVVGGEFFSHLRRASRFENHVGR